MKNGYKVIDIDTHVNPSYDTLAKYVEPSFRSRLDELKPYLRVVDGYTALSIASIPFDRFPGEAPHTEDKRVPSEAKTGASTIRPKTGKG